MWGQPGLDIRSIENKNKNKRLVSKGGKGRRPSASGRFAVLVLPKNLVTKCYVWDTRHLMTADGLTLRVIWLTTLHVFNGMEIGHIRQSAAFELWSFPGQHNTLLQFKAAAVSSSSLWATLLPGSCCRVLCCSAWWHPTVGLLGWPGPSSLRGWELQCREQCRVDSCGLVIVF